MNSFHLYIFYVQGYYCRAQFFHCFGNISSDDAYYFRAIDDYLKSYFLSGKKEHNSASQAITLALEQGMLIHSLNIGTAIVVRLAIFFSLEHADI